MGGLRFYAVFGKIVMKSLSIRFIQELGLIRYCRISFIDVKAILSIFVSIIFSPKIIKGAE